MNEGGGEAEVVNKEERDRRGDKHTFSVRKSTFVRLYQWPGSFGSNPFAFAKSSKNLRRFSTLFHTDCALSALVLNLFGFSSFVLPILALPRICSA